MRDASTAVWLAVLLGTAAAASDAGPVAISSAAALVCAGAAFHWIATLGSLPGPRIGHVVVTGAAAAPFAWALERAARPGLSWPLAVLGVAAGASALAVRSGTRFRRVLASVLGLTFLTIPLLDAMAVASAPDWLRLPTSPLVAVATPPGASRAPHASQSSDVLAADLRGGALVPRSVADARGFATPLLDAPWVNVPKGFEGTLSPGQILVRLIAPVARRSVEGRFIVVASPDLPRDARDLDGTDVVLLLGPLSPDPEGARALASFVRRGGLLAGPASASSFGLDLERVLGAAVPTEDGARGARMLGTGRVVRVTKADGLEAVVAAGLAEPQFATVFDRAGASQVGLLGPGSMEAESRLPVRLPPSSLLLLSLFSVTAVAAARFRASVGVGATVLASTIAMAALSLLDPRPPEARSDAFALDLGGPGGRRIEALRVVAGAEGWRSATPIRSEGGLRVIGFGVVRDRGRDELVLSAHGVGWIVEDALATGATEGLSPLATVPDWSLPLLRRGRDRPAGVRIFGGERVFSGDVPPGVARPSSVRTLVLIPGRP